MRFLTVAAHTIFLLLLTTQAVFAGGSQLALSAGRTVLDLSVEGTQISAQELKTHIPFLKGSILRPELVRQGVVNFFRSGKYENVEVLIKESRDGVFVKYLLYPKKWLEQIRFRGNFYIDDGELLSKVDLRSREEINDEKLKLNVERLTKYYEFKGFPDSDITYNIELEEDNRTKVVFNVREGTRLFISDVRLAGQPGLSRTKLLSLIVSMPGSKLDGDNLDKDIEKVRHYLRKKMYLTPVLSYHIEPAQDFKGAVDVVFNIEKGPEFKLQVSMDDEKQTLKLTKRMRSIFLDSATPEKAKLVTKKHVLDLYHNEGYPFTAVNLQDHMNEANTRTITLEVDRGFRVVIGNISIEDVNFFPEEAVRENLGLLPGRPFVNTELEEGMEKVRLEYRKEGFLSTILSRQPLKFIDMEDYQEVEIRMKVQEGPRNVISSLKVLASPIQEERTLELLGAKNGDPYVPEVINSGREDLLQELGKMGYLYASITVDEPQINPDNTVELTISIDTGPLVRLGEVIVNGNDSVRTKIIRVALAMKRGEILTREKILKAQDRIYDLKVMSSVDVQLADPQTPQQHKDLIVRVKERPKYVARLKGGYGSEDKLRGEVSVTNRNFQGMARSLSLSGKASDIERGTTLLYSHPWFQSLPMDMTLSLSDLIETKESYSRDSLSVAVDFVRELSDQTESRFGYFFEGLRLFDVSPDAQLSPDDEGKTDVAALVGEILHDARDDFLDPWSGLLGDIIIEYAASELGSKTEYVKTELAVRKYVNLVDAIVVAGLLRLGKVEAYGQSEEVIISKRFFLGGQNSVRGYRLDSLGPRDANGDPVGGNYMFNANLELRFPFFKTLRGVVFLDSGSVWLKNASDPDDEKFNLRTAAGAGLRWTSPIGPLSLDYGYKLNPADDDTDKSRVHFSIGHAF